MAVVNTRPKSPTRTEAITRALVNRPIYSSGVLIGNWVRDRAECPKAGTLYFPPVEKIDYEKMKRESRTPDFRMNKLNSSLGSVYSVIRHDSHDACDNFATTNDLVYNHLPKPLCGPNYRKYKKCKHTFYPQPDLTECFGNVTEWGLRKSLDHEWKCTAVSDYITTSYEETFLPPDSEEYLQPCERRPKHTSFTKTFHFKMTKPKQSKQ